MIVFNQVVRKTSQQSVGVRFLIFPQPPFIVGYEQPDRVWLTILPDEISSGPSDARMYVVDPLFPKAPYQDDLLPPFEGERRPPVRPAVDGNFDNIDPGSRAFLGVHAYACVNFVLDAWKSYLNHPVTWFFANYFSRLEIVPFVQWNNAHAGFGFLEFGYSTAGGVMRPYALNFDSIAHEVGHLILLEEIGVPLGVPADSDYFPFSEAFCDLVSLITFLRFDSAIDRLLRRTKGNLLLFNELNRFAETSPETQIRMSSNFKRMSDVTREVHDRSRPFVGAIFDSIVEIYHSHLVKDGCADPRLLSIDLRELTRDALNEFGAITANAFQESPLFFKTALTKARDEIALAIGRSLRQLHPATLTYSIAAQAIISEAKADVGHSLRSNFMWREISV